MSGGEPPLPPSRPPYHWHGRPTHRRRGTPVNTRNGWIGRRPRSPPLPPPRPRHLRPYKHHRHLPQTPPSLSQSLSAPYHPLGPPPPLSRTLQGRLRSPPRSPIRHSDLPSHRVDSQPYRGEPGPSHRVEPPEHLSFRGPDPPPFRPLPPKSRADSFSFSSERPSLRPPSDHPPPYRGEPGPLYRADSVPHRDDFEPRRSLGGMGGGGSTDGLPSRPDASSQYAPWFRQPNKIHKTLKPKKRRPHPHIVGALRTSGPYLPKPQSPILSRIGVPIGERPAPGSRMGIGSTPPPIRRGPGPTMSSPKLSQDLSSTSSRSNTHDPHVFGPAKQRRSMSSPRPLQNFRSISSPDERTNNDRQKLQPNGPVRVNLETQEKVFHSAEKRPRSTPVQRTVDKKSSKAEVVGDGTLCNGTGWSHANGPIDTLKKTSETAVKPSGAISSATASELGSKEPNGVKPEAPPKNVVATKPSEVKAASEVKPVSETKPVLRVENRPSEAKKEALPSVESERFPRPRPKSESPGSKVASPAQQSMEPVRRPSDPTKEEPSAPISEDQPSAPQRNEKRTESVTKTLPPALQSEPAASKPKLSKSIKPATKSHADSQSEEALLSTGSKKGLTAAPSALSVPEAPVPIPAPAMSLLRSTPKSRTRSSSFEGKLNSLSSFAQGSSPPPTSSVTTDFLRGSATKTGVASNDLVRQIHEVEGKITAIARTIADLKNAPPKKEHSLPPASKPPKAEVKSAERDADRYAALAREVVANAEARIVGKPPKRSRRPLHSEARLLLVRNQAVAGAAHARLRTFCSDTELGLDAVVDDVNLIGGEVCPELRWKVAEYLKRERTEDFAKRRHLKKEYSLLRQSWHESLNTARENLTKEKRDALRERDRYILLCTRGTSALLTSRTSSGRTSTKVVPSVGANGQTNGTAELDQRLDDIETEGGTPGSRLIWSKTLAEIPTQKASRPPMDCFSVLMTDPVAEHHAARAVNPWRFEEVLVFLDKYLTCSKNFIKIASFLEHKSPRDCSYFYYMNKLRLGLKQLTKDASAMKRRGTLRRNLIQIAKQFVFLDPNKDSSDSFQVSVQNAVAVSVAGKFMISSDVRASGFLGVGSNRHGYSIERRDPRDVPFKRSERILNDVKAIDLTGIDRRPFAQAIAAHGTDWKAIASYLSLPGKSSTHYREFFRRNKRKLEAEDIREHSRARLLLPSRSPNSGARYSPRMSPRSSPRHSAHGNRSKASYALEVSSSELMHLDDTDNDDLATRIILKDDKDTSEQRAKEEVSRPKHETDGPSRAAMKNEREGKKGKPTATWTSEECVQFRALFKEHGRDWKAISRVMVPKTPTQIKGYWRTVAHEVGDGLSGDVLRSRSERKRMRRRTSSETLSRHSPTASHNDQRASPKLKSGGTKGHGHAGTEENQEDVSRRENMNDVGEDSERRKEVMTVVSKEPVGSTKSDSGGQGGTPTEIATSEERADISKSRLPMLRSLPLPVRRSGGNYSGKSKSGENATNEDELRRAAESYGVLELLGKKLHEGGDGEGKHRGSG